MSEKTVWYFAYGSNLNEKVFCKRRGCKPLDNRYAVLKGWRLRFNLPAVPFLEPAMANAEPIPATDDTLMDANHPREVHGIAYKITEKEWDEVLRTEGDGRIGSYVPVEVDVRCCKTGELIRALTLSARPYYLMRDRDRQASKRYMTLIIDGAEAAGFDAKYVTWLREKGYFERQALRQQSPVSFWLSYAFLGVFVVPFFLGVVAPSLLLSRIPFIGRRVRWWLTLPLQLLFVGYVSGVWGIHDAMVSLFGGPALNKLLLGTARASL